MNKWLLTTALIGSALAFGYVHFKDTIFEKTAGYIKENFSFRVAKFRVQKVTKTGVELRIDAELINLSPITVKTDNLKLDVYYLKNGQSPSALATTVINSPFTLKAKDTTRIPDIKVSASYLNMLSNFSLIADLKPTFRVEITGRIEGKDISFSNTLTVDRNV